MANCPCGFRERRAAIVAGADVWRKWRRVAGSAKVLRRSALRRELNWEAGKMGTDKGVMEGGG